MTKKQETAEDKALNSVCERLTKEGPRMMAKLTKKEENVSAAVGFLVLLIVFLLGNLLGHWVSNQLKEPTWHSPKGCPLFVQGEAK